MNFLLDPNYYNWLVLAFVLLIIEISSFTFLALFFAISALVVAAINYLFPEMGVSIQILLFSIMSILSVLIWSYSLRNVQDKMGDKKINNRMIRYVDKVAETSSLITAEEGKIKIQDSFWSARLADPSAKNIDEGIKVKIVSSEGSTLLVKEII